MTIIIEGANATGKTTLSIALSRALQFRVNKLPRARTFVDQNRLYELVETLLATNSPVILDRVPFISDLIYPNPPTATTIELAQSLIKKYNPIIIYCRIPPETAYTSYINRKHTKEDFSFAVYDLYDRLMANIKHIKYDYTTDDLHTLINTVIEEIKYND